MTKAKGTVKWYNKDKQYGFIAPDAGGSDVFVHYSQLQNANINILNEGDKIEFDCEERAGKMSAINIELIG
jgi:CspA family cold shock protein